MSTIHFLNVGKGDCTLIQHNSGHNTLVDICKGNYQPPKISQTAASLLEALDEVVEKAKGNFGMSKKPTNPVSYLDGVGVDSLFRFILTHPDMDHLDGFNALLDSFDVANFWDSGVRREKPEFADQGPYNEADWNRYEAVINGEDEELKAVVRGVGAKFKYANIGKEGHSGGDGLHILAPDPGVIEALEEGEDVNDKSYVILYRSPGGKIIIPGDAHDETWKYVIEHFEKDVKNCDLLFAPHHGRKSARSFDFLDVLKPQLTLFGCAESGHLAYDAWSSRGLQVITNNQAGNIVIESDKRLDFYVENHAFAKASGQDTSVQNSQGYAWLGYVVPKPQSTKSKV